MKREYSFMGRGKKLRIIKAILAAVTATVSVMSASAQVSMLIVPHRVVFNQSVHQEDISVTNTSTDTLSYIVNPKQYRMLRDGAFEEVIKPDPGQYFASDYLAYSPRRFKLGPGESQSVEVAIIGKEQLPDGEYRSHLVIRTEVKRTTGYSMTIDGHGITASLMPSLAVTIPVIIRVGNLSADVSVSNLFFLQSETGPQLELALNRKGDMSVYGDITVEHISEKMDITRVATIKGIAVYTPNDTRCMIINLDDNKKVDYSKGCLRVRYNKLGDSNYTLAESELMLGITKTN